MSVDYNRKKIKRTKHFKNKRQMRLKDFVPVLEMFFKVLTVAVILFLGGLLCRECYGRIKASPYFYVKKMIFKGCGNAKEKELYELSGIKSNTNLFAVDLKEFTDNISKHEWVKMASAKKQYPDKLLVHIQERVPVAMINIKGLHYIDDEGVVFKALGKEDRKDFIVITGIASEAAFSGKPGDRKLLARAISLVNMLKKRSDFCEKDVSELNVDEEEGMTLFTYNKAIPVKVGFNFSNKRFDRLVKVFRELNEMKIDAGYIDIDYDKRIVVGTGART